MVAFRRETGSKLKEVYLMVSDLDGMQASLSKIEDIEIKIQDLDGMQASLSKIEDELVSSSRAEEAGVKASGSRIQDFEHDSRAEEAGVERASWKVLEET